MAQYITLFFNDKKEDGDALPLYQNGKVQFEETMTLEKGKFYQVALWKKTKNKNGEEINALSIKIDESDYWNAKSKEEVPF
jgi:hypothetical protein|tara:strand:+ start:190 stop:432 length:243 start_codon:yes stop_codon:yes gene_type:complete